MARVTTNDIARHSGVSQTTVSFVLNGTHGTSISESTKKKVLDTAKELGYKIKKTAPSQTGTLKIALLTPTLSNFYYPMLINSIELYARSKDVNIVVVNTLRNDEINVAREYGLLKQMDGILSLFTPRFPLPEGIPCVVVGEKIEGVGMDTFSVNSKRAGQLVAEHLISKGHHKITYITTPMSRITPARQNRLEGIRGSLSAHGLERYMTIMEPETEMEIEDRGASFEYICGRDLTNKLLESRQDVSAIIAVNDMTAAGVITALTDRGISIPGQIAVAGFDNLIIAEILRPTLTTVDQMASLFSRFALDTMLEKLRYGTQSDRLVSVEYEPNLIVRNST
jgi:LacI family transcriptional regulator